jgi:hypothetical protein
MAPLTCKWCAWLERYIGYAVAGLFLSAIVLMGALYGERKDNLRSSTIETGHE